MKSPPHLLQLAIGEGMHAQIVFPYSFIMVLHMNDEHIVYFHMDTTQSVGLVQTYFSHPEFLIVQCWIHATFLFPDTATQTEPHAYCSVKFFPGVGYIHLGIPYACIMAILNHYHTITFCINTFPAL